MKRTIVILGITLATLGLFMATLATAIRSRHTPVAGASEAQVDLPPQETVAKTNGYYKLIVGGDPRFNREQRFSPPTNSVVISNGEEQLRQLIEQSRPRQTNSQQ